MRMVFGHEFELYLSYKCMVSVIRVQVRVFVWFKVGTRKRDLQMSSSVVQCSAVL